MPIVARPRLAAEAAITVAKYARVSTLDQLEGFGLEDQDKIMDGWLDRHPDASVFDTYVDEAVSGALESRPEMDRLMVDGHKQSFNRILVPKVDRIGRTARAAYQWAWNMADIGIYFISVTEGIDTSTDAGWAQLMQHVTFSEMEWRRIKERTFAGRELKVSYGGWPGGPAPYGYAIAQDTTTIGTRRKKFSVLVTDEKESMVLWTAACFIIDKGMNITEAAEALNARELFTRSGVPWSIGNLRNRLHSETIHDGYVLYRKTNRGNGKNTTLRYEDGTPVHGEPVKIGVPPIFDEARATALMETLKKLGFQHGREGDRIYPLSGRIDSHCGSVYTGVGRGEKKERAYRCKGLSNKGNSCGEPYFGADEIEDAVWGELTKLLKGEDRLKAMAAEWVNSLPGDKTKYEKRVAEYNRKIGEQEHLIHTRVPEYMRQGVDAEIVAAAVRTMKEDLEKFQEERGIAEQWLKEYAEYERQAHNLVDIANNARGRLDGMGLAERKEIFDMFNLRVSLGKLDHLAKPGVRCGVQQWHWETGTLVPPDPTDAEWEAVLETLRPFFTGRKKKHFTSKYDIRTQFCGMLHRLRYGLSWVDMPLTWGPVNPMRERQLAWLQAGAWPAVMETLCANERGVEAYKRPTLPQLIVTGQLRAGLLAEVRSQVTGAKPKTPEEGAAAEVRVKTVDSPTARTSVEATVNLIGNGLYALLRNPGQRELLQASLAAGGTGLLETGIEELLRYDGPVEMATWRYATRALTIGGQEIPAGDPVLVVLAAADRDPERFDGPDVLDLARRDNQHLGYGHGIHYCLGAPLARLEGQAALATLLTRLPDLRLAADPAELRWRGGLIMRGLRTLPVEFSPSVPLSHTDGTSEL